MKDYNNHFLKILLQTQNTKLKQQKQTLYILN